MKTKFKIFWIVLLAIIKCCSHHSMNDEQIHNILKEKVDATILPGMGALVFNSESVIAKSIYGLRKINTCDSVKVSDRFHIGSCGKAMLSFAAASCVKKGLINWDTRYLDLYPEYKKNANPGYYNINLQQLLSHRAGLPYREVTKNELYNNIYFVDTLLTRDFVINWGLSKTSGNGGYQYSNIGYTMAAMMLEKVTGKDWKSIPSSEVFTPLQMDAQFGWPVEFDTKQPWGHWVNHETNELIIHDPQGPYKLSKFSISEAGDISISMEEYTKFLQDQLRGLKGQGLLDQSFYKMMHSGETYGLGWALMKNYHGNFNVSLHSGSGGNFYCQVVLLPRKNLGIVLVSNCHVDGISRIFEDTIMEILKL